MTTAPPCELDPAPKASRQRLDVGDGQLVELAPTDPTDRDDVPFDPWSQAEDRALLLGALVLLQVRQPLVGDIGHRDRLLAHVDPGVLLTLKLAQLVGDRLSGRTRDPLPAALAVRADTEVDRGDPPLDRHAAPGPRVVAPVDRPLPVRTTRCAGHAEPPPSTTPLHGPEWLPRCPKTTKPLAQAAVASL